MPVPVLAELRRQELIRHIGLSNATAAQVAEAQAITEVVCVQNQYNLAHRHDDALIDDLAREGIACVPFFPLGGFTPLQSSTLSDVAGRLVATTMQVALAWLLHRSPKILLILRTTGAEALGRPLTYVDMPFEQWVDQELRPRGLLEHVHNHMLTMAKLHAANRYDRLTRGVDAILGRPGTRARDFVARNARSFVR